MQEKKVLPLLFDTYLAVVKNSVGSKLFQNFYATVGGKRTDIMKNGELSCAFFVSSILTLFKFIKAVHGTVDATVKDLWESGWRGVKKPKIGSVLVWEKVEFAKGDAHKHIGFYVGDHKAISNSWKTGHPAKHHWSFNGKRKVDLVLWNPKLKIC